MAYANTIGKPKSVVIGVETKDIADGGDPETISFHEEGRTYMEQELNKVYDAFLNDSAFGGIALHHYSSIVDFPSEWGPGGYAWRPPADHEPPSTVSGATAATFDFQRINITYNMAMDNTAVNAYRIYCGTEADFEIGPATYAGISKGLSYKDTECRTPPIIIKSQRSISAAMKELPARRLSNNSAIHNETDGH